MNTSIQNDIKKLSPDAQTSSLEGFHSTLNQWHPKMLCFSWLGTYCRYSMNELNYTYSGVDAVQFSVYFLEMIKPCLSCSLFFY